MVHGDGGGDGKGIRTETEDAAESSSPRSRGRSFNPGARASHAGGNCNDDDAP